MSRIHNLYKRNDIFKCRHSSHRDFGYWVSVYHVMERRGCFPYGCIDYRWHCARREHKQRCPKGFTKVGKNCGGCTHFYDEKVHFSPEICLSDEAWEAFRRDYRLFRYWVEENLHKPRDVYVKVRSLKPCIRVIHRHQKMIFRHQGAWILPDQAFIGHDEVQGGILSFFPRWRKEAWHLSPGDVIEGEAELTVEDGWLVLHRWRHGMVQKGSIPFPKDKLLYKPSQHARLQPGTPDKCIHCDQGLLVNTGRKTGKRKQILCLEGFYNPDLCSFQGFQKIRHGISPLG